MYRYRIVALLLGITVVATAGSAAAELGGPSVQRRAQLHHLGAPLANGVAQPGKAAEFLHALASRRGQTGAASARTGASPTSTSPTSAAILPVDPPAFVSPADGAAVSDTVTVTVSSTADRVRFFLEGIPTELAEATVSGGTATAQVPLWGASGVRNLLVDQCVGTDCSAQVARSVSITNSPIAFARPQDGSTVGSSFVVSATSGGGSLRFDVDGTPVRSLAAPYQATVSTASFADGSHVLGLVQCDTTGVLCQGPTDSRSIVVQKTQSPRGVGASPTYFSPNRDRVQDNTVVRYVLPATSQVTVSVRTAAGALVRGPLKLGTQSGARTWTFNGRNNRGSVLPSGAYVVRLDTVSMLSGSPVPGTAEVVVFLDLVRPNATLHAGPRTFYPIKDGYLDTTSLRATGSEPLTRVRAEVLSDGRLIWSHGARVASSPVAAVTWTGHDRSGRLVAAGTYRYRFQLRDRAGNTRTTSLAAVTVSHRRLVRHSGRVIVTPASSKIGAFIGACSEIGTPARSEWPGSFAYLGNFNVCFDPAPEDTLAITRHQVGLPSAVRYGPVRIDTYGAQDLPGYPDQGATVYEDRTGYLSDAGADLTPDAGWHLGPSVPGSAYVTSRHKLRWWTGTTDNNYYDVRSFRVSYVYFLLR